MMNTFRMSDLGLLSYYLGLEVMQGAHGIMLRQGAYAIKILEKAGWWFAIQVLRPWR